MIVYVQLYNQTITYLEKGILHETNLRYGQVMLNECTLMRRFLLGSGKYGICEKWGPSAIDAWNKLKANIIAEFDKFESNGLNEFAHQALLNLIESHMRSFQSTYQTKIKLELKYSLKTLDTGAESEEDQTSDDLSGLTEQTAGSILPFAISKTPKKRKKDKVHRSESKKSRKSDTGSESKFPESMVRTGRKLPASPSELEAWKIWTDRYVPFSRGQRPSKVKKSKFKCPFCGMPHWPRECFIAAYAVANGSIKGMMQRHVQEILTHNHKEKKPITVSELRRLVHPMLASKAKELIDNNQFPKPSLPDKPIYTREEIRNSKAHFKSAKNRRASKESYRKEASNDSDQSEYSEDESVSSKSGNSDDSGNLSATESEVSADESSN